jgi:chemotaxis protein MotB
LIAELAGLLNVIEAPLSVEGHTDNVPIHNPRFPSNWELSTARATAVTRALMTQGIAATRLRAIGYADTRPRDDNDTGVGRDRNRRVSLVLHLSGSETAVPQVSQGDQRRSDVLGQ